MRIKNLNWLWISVLIVVADQTVKFFVKHHIAFGSSHQITSFFNLVHARNYGAAFSFMDTPGGHQRWLFSLISLAVSGFLTAWLLMSGRGHRLKKISLALIIGGALGNFWGRFSVGYVVDFLDFHVAGHHWPAFNIADSAVCVGAVMLFWLLLRGKA